MLSRLVVLLVLGAIASCTPMHVVTHRPSPLAGFGPRRHATLILTPLTSSARAIRSGDDLPRRLGALFERLHTPLLEERSLTQSPPPDAFLVRIALGESHTGGRSGERGYRTFEVTVFAVDGAPLARVATEAGIVPMIDITGRAPILRRSYDVTIDTDFGSRGGSADEDAAYDESVRVLTAELLYQQLAPDLQHAIDAAPAATEIVPPSAGGDDGTMVVH